MMSLNMNMSLNTKMRSLAAALRLGLSAAVALGSVAAAAATPVSPDETDPTVIIRAVEDRELGDKMTSRMYMVIKDSGGRERTRTIQSRAMEFSAGRKTMMLFEAPAEVRNTGFLSFDYDDGDKDDDQWLYLPSLTKTTRISGSDKSGSFLGTDLTFSDMASKDVKNYTYKLLKQSTKVGGEECWLIESRPANDKEKEETGYLKSQVWVSKAKLLPIQVKAWVIKGKRIKKTRFSSIERIDGIWIAKKLTVKTEKNNEMESMTQIIWSDIKFNQDSVSEADFSERKLQQGL